MNKILITAVILSCVTAHTHAAVKCVKKNLNCTFGQTTKNQSDWNKQCENGTVTMRGVAFCGSNNATTPQDSVPVSATVASNVYCWCRMISPAVSYWEYTYTFANAGECATECSDLCAYSWKPSSITSY